MTDTANVLNKLLGKHKKKKFTDRHTFTVSGTKFIIDRKYSPLKTVGTGAYGVVVSAVDKESNKRVAIKKISHAFDDLVDAKRILREIKLLHHCNHENIVGLYDLINPLTKDDFEDVYIVLDFMETDLHKIIYSKNELTDDHCQYFVYQMLRGLKYIHSANILHRDMVSFHTFYQLFLNCFSRNRAIFL
jgi:mitogen-activated protein kinase 1/3